MKHKLYITTSIPYVNAAPHIGFALELVQADVLARYNRLIGRDVRLQTGTDENALKNVLAAQQAGVTTGELVEANAQRFRALLVALDISADDFIRTTEPRHRRGVQRLWRSLADGDLVRRPYIGLYCTGCEDFYAADDLDNGCCPEHGIAPQEVREENYFFRLSKYQGFLEEALHSGRVRVVPQSRLNEVTSFVRRGLTDFSVSRPAERAAGWGTPVPGDDSQIVYVWVDALVNYLSALGYGTDDSWRDRWGADTETVHVIGKNVWKFHAVYWPALLQSAGLPSPDTILVHGFVTAEGRKIGKSLGNAVDPFEIIARYECDPVRYYLLRCIPPFGDGDFSVGRLREVYRTDLANTLGNLVSRLAALCDRAGFGALAASREPCPPDEVRRALDDYRFDKAVGALWRILDRLNRDIERVEPWNVIKAGNVDEAHRHLRRWLIELRGFTIGLRPLLPHTADRIADRLFAGPIGPVEPLFLKLE